MKRGIAATARHWWPLLPAALLTFALALVTVWYCDAISYRFFFGTDPDAVTYRHILSPADVWHSQINHYHTTNGRFVCHFIVQVCCSLVPRWLWALADAAVMAALPCLLFKLADTRKNRLAALSVTVAMTWLLTLWLPFDPPFHVNYIWGASVNAALLIIWLSRRHMPAAAIVAIFVFAFVAGQWNESFSIPVSLTLLIYALRRRFRVSPAQWAAGMAYAAGTLTVTLAPGNFLRLAGVQQAPQTLAGIVESGLPVLIIPAIFGITCLAVRLGGTRLSVIIDRRHRFILLLAVCSYLFCAATGFPSGMRSSTCGACALTALTATIVSGGNKTLRTCAIAAMWLLFASVTFSNIAATRLLNAKYTAIGNRYHASADGVVVLPDSLFVPQMREARLYRMPWVQTERASDPAKPMLRIWPRSLAGIDLQADTNRLIEFGPQIWLMIQSRSNPADFVVHKTLLPGVLDKELQPRQIDFSPQSDIFVDTTAAVSIAVYSNERPYMRATVTMTPRQPH